MGSSDIYRVASLDREGGFEICWIKFLFGILTEGRVNLIVMHGQSVSTLLGSLQVTYMLRGG